MAPDPHDSAGHEHAVQLGLRFSPARIKNWHVVVVIIAPLALALQQGGLRWEELLGTTYSGWRRGVPKDLSSLTLKVRGAVIPLLDAFQWPLDCAAELITVYSRK